MVVNDIILGVDLQISHVDFQPFLPQHVCKDVVHECLKYGWSIAKSEEHDSGLK